MLKESGQKAAYKILQPLVNMLVRYHVSPNMLTTAGLVLNVVAAVLFVIGAEQGERGDMRFIGWGGFIILVAGLFDMLDGQVARHGNRTSRFGALYDSVLDRYSELVMFLGICYYLVSHHYFLSSIFAFLAMVGSMMVSYTRARAEGLGIPCAVGLMQRPERIILIGTSAIVCGVVSTSIGGGYKLHVDFLPFHIFETMSIFTVPITVVAVLANYTAITRLNHCRRVLAGNEDPT